MKSKGPKFINRKKPDDDRKDHPKPIAGGIPCPKCGPARWRLIPGHGPRHGVNKIVRKKCCAKCGHNIRTKEVIESHSAT
jgi:hypothetical protein